MPRYAKRTSSSKLDPYAEKLATWLAIEATKSRKQRRNLRAHRHCPVANDQRQSRRAHLERSKCCYSWLAADPVRRMAAQR